MPVKIKGLTASTSPAKNKQNGGGSPRQQNIGKVPGKAERSASDDPDVVFITIDSQEILKRRKAERGQRAADTGGDVIYLDLSKEYGDYPESCAVDKFGDILIAVRGHKTRRKIEGDALRRVGEEPGAPQVPYVAGVTKGDITVGWMCNDEGTGLVDGVSDYDDYDDYDDYLTT